MELSINPHHHRARTPNRILNPPLHNGMTPERRRCKRRIPRATCKPNLRQRRLDKITRVRDHSRRPSDFRHGRSDKIREDELDIDALRLQLGGERRGPLLQESLGAGVCRKKRTGQKPAERAHGEDEPALALRHPRCDKTSHLERAEAVNGDNIAHLLVWGERERDGVGVALSDVIDEDTDVETGHDRGQLGVVGLVVLGEVHGQDLGLDRRCLGFDVVGERGKLGFSARDKDEIEAFRGELKGVFLPETVGSAGDDCPGAFGSILAQLEIVRDDCPIEVRGGR